MRFTPARETDAGRGGRGRERRPHERHERAAAAAKRRGAGEQLVQDAPQRVQVGCGGRRTARQKQLRRHVGGGAGGGPRRHAARSAAAPPARRPHAQPKPRQPRHPRLVQQHVARPHVPVQSARGVQGGEAGGEPRAHVGRRGLGQPPVGREQGRQVAPAAVFEDEPQVVARFVPGVKLEDVGVVERVHGADLGRGAGGSGRARVSASPSHALARRPLQAPHIPCPSHVFTSWSTRGLRALSTDLTAT